MCTICAAFRPFSDNCEYSGLKNAPVFANLNEGNDAPANISSTKTMQVGDTFRGEIETLGDRDFVRVLLVEGQSYDIRLNGATLSDPVLAVYDQNGNLVTYNDDANQSRDSALTFTASYDGEFYLAALAYNDQLTGTYDLSLGLNTLRNYTNDEIAFQLTNTYWGGNARSHDVNPGGSLTVNLTGLNAAGTQLADWALEAWEDVLGITFVRTTGSADITFTDNRDSDGSATAFASSTVDRSGTILSSRINISDNWSSSSQDRIDGYALQTYLHEIGHALGLGHGGPYNGNASYGTDNSYLNDSWQATVMSYFSQRENTSVDADFAYTITPMIADMIAVHNLYGTPTSVRTGDTVYGYDTNLSGYMGEVFSELAGQSNSPNFSGTRPVTLTIYDNGGRDRIDFRNDTSNQTVDLKEEGISDVYGLVGNLSIARGAVIEDYIAGSGDDAVEGNGKGNRIEGRDGKDVLKGNDGWDVLVGGNNNDKLSGGNGYDTLRGGGANDTIFGGKGFDKLFGGSGKDKLYGDKGQDKLEGGVGDDQLKGGEGKDDFVFKGNIDSDTIVDYELGRDELYLSQGLWSGTRTATEVVNTFATASGGDVVFDFGNGNAITLEGINTLSGLAGDIVFV